MDKFAFDCEIKLAADDTTGVVDGYGSVFGLLDRGGDIVEAGAFRKSLAAWKRKGQPVPMLWQHRPDMPVGVWTDISEDEKGLKVSGQLVLDVPQAAQARALIKAGAIKGLSIGYRTKVHEIDRQTGVRRLKEVDLWEISLVTFPMLPEAQIAGVKGDLDPRELERALRSELNLSTSAAVQAVAIVKKHLREGDGEPAQRTREGERDVLMSLRKAAEALR